MALIPRIFGQRSDVFDPFQDWPFGKGIQGGASLSIETSALANTRIDWKETPEAHIFKADMPGIKKEEVKVEVEEGNVLQINVGSMFYINTGETCRVAKTKMLGY